MSDVVRVPNNKVVEAYYQLKKELMDRGLIEEAQALTAFTMANDISEADGAYPTITSNNNIAFVMIKVCPIDDARMIVSGDRRIKMMNLLEGLRKINNGEDVDLEGLVKEFE